jgi:hypothetical protein
MAHRGTLSLLILLFEIKRNRGVRYQVSKEAATYRNALRCQKLRYRERCMGWRIVVIQDPVLRHVWTNSHDASPQSLMIFCVVILTDCLCSRNPLFVNNTHGIKEAHKHAFNF